MAKRRGHDPFRTCISCGKTRSKRELIRLTATDHGEVRRDVRGPGRGAYVCPEGPCLEKAGERNRLGKALRKQGPLQFDPASFGRDQNHPVQR